MSAEKVLMLVGDYVEDYEAMVPFQALVMVGHTVHAVCPGKVAGVVEGKACTGYPAVGPEVRAAGGRWVELPVDQAHTDGNLVTAPAWPAHPEWLRQFLDALGTKIEP